MTRPEILQEMQPVFRRVFNDPSLTVHDLTTAEDIFQWDSLTHVELIASIEQRFGLVFSFEQVMHLHHVGDMVDLVGKLLPAKV